MVDYHFETLNPQVCPGNSTNSTEGDVEWFDGDSVVPAVVSMAPAEGNTQNAADGPDCIMRSTARAGKENMVHSNIN